jgi:hypothetical protein
MAGSVTPAAHMSAILVGGGSLIRREGRTAPKGAPTGREGRRDSPLVADTTTGGPLITLIVDKTLGAPLVGTTWALRP